MKVTKNITLEKETMERALRLMDSIVKDDKTGEVVLRVHYGSDSSFFESCIEQGLLVIQQEWEEKKRKWKVEK